MTEAGKRLLALLASQRVSQDDSWKNGCLYAEECFRNSLPAIEAEARAPLEAEVERLRAALRQLETEFVDGKVDGRAYERILAAFDRAALEERRDEG